MREGATQKAVLLLGAAGGIGRATAEALRRSGYKIIGADIREPPSCENFELFKMIDLREQDNVRAFCQEVRDVYPELGGVIYCAGVYPVKKSLDYAVELWDEVIDVNLSAAFRILRELWQNISRGGAVVLVASGASHIGSRDVAYSASKAGLVGFARSVVNLLGARGVRVNCVSPGVIETPMSAKMEEASLRAYIERTALGRMGEPSEVASVIEFLLSDKSSYVTGATIDVNGGLYCR